MVNEAPRSVSQPAPVRGACAVNFRFRKVRHQRAIVEREDLNLA